MNLEVNQNHKKIDLSKLKKPLKKIGIGTMLALSLYSGILPATAYAQEPIRIETMDLNQVVEIPEDLKYDISSKVGKTKDDDITIGDLQSITSLFFSVYDENADLSFLNYCTNLNSLMIICHCDGLEYLNSIDSMPSLETIMITNMWNDVEATKENLQFINKCKKLREINFMGVDVHPGTEELLNQTEELSVAFNYNCDLDFNKLTGIKTLDLSGAKPYDIAIYLNSEEYNTLTQNGVNIVFKNDEDKQKYLEASRKLDEMVASLGVTKESTDREKIDAILIYVLEHLEYDSEVSKQLADTGKADTPLVKSFYEDGELYGALEKESAICGNYAALVDALADRLSIPQASYIMDSTNHAWNLMNIDGELYYVDATWLDGQKFYEFVEDENQLGDGSISYHSEKVETSEKIKRGDTDRLVWYNESIDANYISTIDEKSSHVPEHNIPEYMLESGIAVPPKSAQTDYDLPQEGTEIETEYQTQTEKEKVAETEKETEYDLQHNTKEEEIKETDGNTKVKITLNGKTIIISVGALVSAMAALGVAVSVKKKKERERERKRRFREQMYSTNMFDDPFSPYGNPYNNPYDNRRRY